jgi:hypothetical protein
MSEHTHTEIVKADNSLPEQAGTPPAPSQILAKAVESGVDPEGLEKLADLVERFEDREAKKAFHRALKGFQSDCPDIEHNKTAGSGNFSYSYADLAQIKKTIQPYLDEHGLSYSFDTEVDNGYMTILCHLSHDRGYTQTSRMTLPIDNGKMNNIQQFGSTDSYGRRYVLLNALGIITAQDDNDANMPPEPRQNRTQTGNNGEGKPKPRAKTESPKESDSGGLEKITDKQLKSLHAIGKELYPEKVDGEDLWDIKRPQIVRAITAAKRDKPVESSKELTQDEATMVIKKLNRQLDVWNSLEVEAGSGEETPDGFVHIATVSSGTKAFKIFMSSDSDDIKLRCPCRKDEQPASLSEECIHVRKARYELEGTSDGE